MFYLSSNRLSFHPFVLADLDYLHALWVAPEMRRYLWDNEIIPRELAEEIIVSSSTSFAEHGFGFWKLVRKDSGRPVGFCGLRSFENEVVGTGEVEILYGITAAEWGQGLAVEAARTVLHYAFAERSLLRVYAGADAPNTASIRVMERLGMWFDQELQLKAQTTIYYVLTKSAWLTEISQPNTSEIPR